MRIAYIDFLQRYIDLDHIQSISNPKYMYPTPYNSYGAKAFGFEIQFIFQDKPFIYKRSSNVDEKEVIKFCELIKIYPDQNDILKKRYWHLNDYDDLYPTFDEKEYLMEYDFRTNENTFMITLLYKNLEENVADLVSLWKNNG